MARYKEYEKKDIVGSIRIDCYIGETNNLFINYRCIPDLGNEKDIVIFSNPKAAENYMEDLGYKEWMI